MGEDTNVKNKTLKRGMWEKDEKSYYKKKRGKETLTKTEEKKKENGTNEKRKKRKEVFLFCPDPLSFSPPPSGLWLVACMDQWRTAGGSHCCQPLGQMNSPDRSAEDSHVDPMLVATGYTQNVQRPWPMTSSTRADSGAETSRVALCGW